MLRLFIAILAVGLGVVQYQLWAGRSSWFRMRELEASLEAQRHENERLRARNESLSAELYSLQNRRDAIEERARSELNMVKAGEVLFRIQTPKEERRAAAAAEREKMHAIKSPDIKAGSRPTFEPKKSDLYHAPKNLRAPKARDRRAD